MSEGASVKIKSLYNNHFHSRRHSFFPTAVCLIHCFHPSRSLCVTFPCVFMLLLICLPHYQSSVLSHMFPSFPLLSFPHWADKRSIALTKPALPGVVGGGVTEAGTASSDRVPSSSSSSSSPPATQMLRLPPSERSFPSSSRQMIQRLESVETQPRPSQHSSAQPVSATLRGRGGEGRH